MNMDSQLSRRRSRKASERGEGTTPEGGSARAPSTERAAAAGVPRRERERKRHRQDILAAAVKLFSSKGFEKTTMADVAAEAEFAVGTLYKFFEDKKALYRTIIREIATDMNARLLEALRQGGTEVEQIGRYIDTKMSLFAKHAPVGRLYFSQTTGASWSPEATLDAELRDMFRKMLNSLGGTFRRGIRKKLFVDQDPMMLAMTLEGLTHAFISPLAENPQAFRAEEMAATVKSLFFNGVLRSESGGRPNQLPRSSGL
jgi:TetR/AcrR family transcriptional regulator